jgi:hypothetical protein
LGDAAMRIQLAIAMSLFRTPSITTANSVYRNGSSPNMIGNMILHAL